MRWTEADASVRDGKPPIWVVVITLPDGRRYFAGSRQARIATRFLGSDGPYQIQGLLRGLETFEEEFDYYSQDAVGALAQASVEIAVSDDLAELAGDWQHLAAATAEVALVWEDQEWEDRAVLMGAGLVHELEIGELGEAVTFVLETLAEASSRSIGDAERTLGDDFPGALVDTVAGAMTDISSAEQIWVLGDPESVPAYKVGDVGGTDRLVLCGHALAAGAVDVFEDAGAAAGFTPADTATANGTYSYVTSAAVFRAANGAYTWSALRGGVTRGGVAVKGAGAILRWLLEQSGVAVDWRAMEEVLRFLGGVRLGLWVDQETPALDIIRQRLLPILPVVEVRGATGLWYAVGMPWERPIEGELTVGQELLGPAGPLTFSDRDEVRNRFTMRYGRDEFADEYSSSVTLDSASDALCHLSEDLFGVQVEETIETACVWDGGTAMWLLRARASLRAIQRRRRAYLAAPDQYPVRAGGVYTLVDPTRGVDQVRVAVRSIERGAFAPIVHLEFDDRTAISRVAA